MLAIAASMSLSYAQTAYEEVIIDDFRYHIAGDTAVLVNFVEMDFDALIDEGMDDPWSYFEQNPLSISVPQTISVHGNTYRVTTIGDNAFQTVNVPVMDIQLPDSGILYIGKNAFAGGWSEPAYALGLPASVNIPHTVISIGDSAYFGVHPIREEVFIPKSCTHIGKMAFRNSHDFSGEEYAIYGSIGRILWVNVEDGNPVYDSRNNCNAIIETATNTLIFGVGTNCAAVPNGVTHIGDYAFYGSDFCGEDRLPNSLISIGEGAFFDCWFESITIPSSVIYIGDYAFSTCTQLKTITIPEGITQLKNGIFSDCVRLKTVSLPNSLTTIGESAFNNCERLTTINIPNNVTNIGNYAFNGCGRLTSISLSDNVTSIGDGAFQSCERLISINIPNSVTSIGEWAFSHCTSLTSVTIDAITPPTIGNRAWEDIRSDCPIYVPCGTLEAYQSTWPAYASQITYYPLDFTVTGEVNSEEKGSVSIFGNMCEGTTITATPNYGYHFIQWSDGVTDNPRTIVLTQDTSFTAEFAPNPIITINANPEFGTVEVEDYYQYPYVTFSATPYYGFMFTQWNDGNTDNPRTIYLTQDTTFTAEFAIAKSGACGDNLALTWTYDDINKVLTISGNGSLKSNYTYGFEAPGNAEKLVIESGVNEIQTKNAAFSNCTHITSVTLNSNAVVNKQYSSSTNLGGMFGSQVHEFIIGDSVTAIGKNAFYKASNMTSIILGSRITSIGYEAFRESGLLALDIPDNVTNIDAKICRNCANIVSVTIGANVLSIGEYAFAYCNKLASVTINATTPPTLSTKDILSESKIAKIYVPCGTLDEYRNAIFWSSYASQIKYPSLQYSITANAENGIVNYPTTTCVEMALIATPDYGYHFTQWSDGVTDNPRAIVLTQDTTFTAEFAPNQYTISVTCDSTRGSIEGESGSFDYLSEHTYTAIPNYGYHFVQWDMVNTINSQTPNLTVLSPSQAENMVWMNDPSLNNTLYIVRGYITRKVMSNTWCISDDEYGYNNFVVYRPTKTPQIGDYVEVEGYVTLIDAVGYPGMAEGATLRVLASTAPGASQYTQNPITIVLEKDLTLSAVIMPNTYTVSDHSNHSEGYISGTGTFDYLSQQTIEAIPNEHYHFVQWSDGLPNNPRTFVLTQDTTFTAVFAPNPVITYSYDAQMGYVNGPTTTETGVAADYISFEAIPNHGYHFVQWSDGVIDNPRTVYLTQDTAFTAEFAQTFSGQCGDNLYWEYANNKLTFTGSGDMYEYYDMDIPWSLFTQSVRSIDFAPDMTSISPFAYQNMNYLRKINLPSEIQRIGNFAFAYTGISNISIPNSVHYLGSGAFEGCSNVDSLIVGSGITAIYDQFRGCSGLQYLQLSQNMSYIDYGAFYDCRWLEKIVCYAINPPMAYPDEPGMERSFYNENAYLLVPCENLAKYQVSAAWGSFKNKECLSSQSGTAVAGEVTVIPGDADATFTWPTESSAETYNLEITKDGIVFCTLTFNSQGQLLVIAFAAPGRNGQSRKTPSATLATNGMTFQVTGLDYASHYQFSFATKSATKTLFTYQGEFNTNGMQGIENTQADSNAPVKVIIDNQIFILRGDKIYTIQGQEVQ